MTKALEMVCYLVGMTDTESLVLGVDSLDSIQRKRR
jgi:hypothetical protein